MSKPETCVWYWEGEGSTTWNTQCGQTFSFDEDCDNDPIANGFKFCCFCGGAVEVDVTEEEDETE